MSDSEEYDKISDFEFDESEEEKINENGGNSVAEIVPRNVAEDDKSESNDSYDYCSDNESLSSPSVEASVGESKMGPDSFIEVSQQSTNQKMKDLTIEDPINAIAESAEAEIVPSKELHKEAKSVTNDYARLLEEDEKYNLDTKLHDHIFSLCSEAQRIVADEYEKCVDYFGVRDFAFERGQTALVDATTKKKEEHVRVEATKDAYHKMFLAEQKYINLQIELAECENPLERKVLTKKYKEAEKNWINLKTEYEKINEKSEEKDTHMDTTSSNEDSKDELALQENDDIVTEKYFDAPETLPDSPKPPPTTSSSSPFNSKKAELEQQIQKAKETMQKYAQNYSSLKLQMYQQNDKRKKAKFSKFCFQAEERWKKSKKEYEELCKKVNKNDSIDPVVAEYKEIKAQLREVKQQIKSLKKATSSGYCTPTEYANSSKNDTTETLDLNKQNENAKNESPDAVPSKYSTPLKTTMLELTEAVVNYNSTVPIRQDEKIQTEAESLTAAYDHMNDCEKRYLQLLKDLEQTTTVGYYKIYLQHHFVEAKKCWEDSKIEFQKYNEQNKTTAAAILSQNSVDLLPNDKDDQIYQCEKCKTYLSSQKELVSSKFFGITGAAFLFSKVENVEHGEASDKYMMTGKHVVKDVYCKKCHRKLGWFYESATAEEQKYKEGKTVLEKFLIREVSTTVSETDIITDSNPQSSKPSSAKMIPFQCQQESANGESEATLLKLNNELVDAKNQIQHLQQVVLEKDTKIKNLEVLNALQNTLLEEEKAVNDNLRKRVASDSEDMEAKRFKDNDTDKEDHIKLISYKVYKNDDQ